MSNLNNLKLQRVVMEVSEVTIRASSTIHQEEVQIYKKMPLKKF